MRRALLRVCSAYRTTPTAGAEAIAGIAPAHLLVEERTLVYNTNDRVEARQRLEQKWQEEWEDPEATTAQWTRRLMPDIRGWSNRRHGETNYYLTQFLTGHGIFGNYLLRFGLIESDECWYCREPDDP